LLLECEEIVTPGQPRLRTSGPEQPKTDPKRARDASSDGRQYGHGHEQLSQRQSKLAAQAMTLRAIRSRHRWRVPHSQFHRL
jgi:hypothetical protein